LRFDILEEIDVAQVEQRREVPPPQAVLDRNAIDVAEVFRASNRRRLCSIFSRE